MAIRTCQLPTMLAVTLAFRASAVAAVPARSSDPSTCPTPTSQCVTLSGGPRLGGTLNGDQWVLGGQARLNLPCFGGLALETVGQFGFGGNHMTLRPSLRLMYEWWIGGRCRWCQRHRD